MTADWGGLYWTHPGMGLQKQGSTPLHAWLCPNSINEIQSPTTTKTSVSTIPPCAPKLWTEDTTPKARQHSTTTQLEAN